MYLKERKRGMNNGDLIVWRGKWRVNLFFFIERSLIFFYIKKINTD